MYILGIFSLFTKCSRTWGHFQILSVLQTFSFVIFAAQAKQKTDEASRSEAKFLKMKAWSKSRIRQLEEELKRSQVRVSSCPSRMNKAFCAFVLCLWQRSQIHCQCSKRGKKTPVEDRHGVTFTEQEKWGQAVLNKDVQISGFRLVQLCFGQTYMKHKDIRAVQNVCTALLKKLTPAVKRSH